MTFWKWSRTAASNATADGTCPWPEGMAPSQVNDSARGNMAALAKYRDDMSGALITGGTASAYTLTTNQGFASPIADGTGLCFWAHATNAAGATLNVDGTGAAPFMAPINIPLQAGVLIAGTPYKLRYTTAPGWVLEGVMGGPYAIPIGAFMPYLSTTPPTSNFALPYGQPISRTTYATLFAMIGTTFGVGDGSSTFNLPDLRGRTIVGQDNMGGVALGLVTTAGGGLDGTTLGAKGGTQNRTLVPGNLPPYTPSGSVASTWNPPSLPGSDLVWARNNVVQNVQGSGGSSVLGYPGVSVITTPAAVTSSFTGNAQGGNSDPVFNLQPSIVLPMLLRVI